LLQLGHVGVQPAIPPPERQPLADAIDKLRPMTPMIVHRESETRMAGDPSLAPSLCRGDSKSIGDGWSLLHDRASAALRRAHWCYCRLARPENFNLSANFAAESLPDQAAQLRQAGAIQARRDIKNGNSNGQRQFIDGAVAAIASRGKSTIGGARCLLVEPAIGCSR
jgi:hypothetical protein